MTKSIENNIDTTIHNLVKRDEKNEHISDFVLSEKIVLPNLEQSNGKTQQEKFLELNQNTPNSSLIKNPVEKEIQKEYINDFVFFALLNLDINSDSDMYNALIARENLNLNEKDLICLIKKTLSFNSKESFVFLLDYQKKLPSLAINLLSDILDCTIQDIDKNLLNYERFSMILERINKKYFYVTNLENLFLSILYSGLLWPIKLLKEKISFKDIPDLVSIIYTLLDNFKSSDLEQKEYLKHNDFIISLLTILLENIDFPKKHLDKICKIGLDLAFKNIPDLFYFLSRKKTYEKYLSNEDNLSDFFKICILNLNKKNFEHIANANKEYFKKSDKEGNNIFYYSLMNEHCFMIHLYQKNIIDADCFVSMFFSENIYGSSVFDIFKAMKSPHDIILCILNEIIDPKSDYVPLLKTIPYNDNNFVNNGFLKKYNLDLFKKIESRVKSFSTEKYHTLYDSKSIEILDNKIAILSSSESEDFSRLVSKIKEESNVKILINNEKLKQNIESLRKKFPNFHDFIDFVESNIYLNELSDNCFSIPPSLLVGSPGIGKTFFMSSLAKSIGNSYELISMESVSAGFVLTGNTSQWAGSKSGLIFEKAFYTKYANNMFLLDELDKISDSKHPVSSVLLPLLESHTSCAFKDEYIGMPIDISKMVWIATANDKNTISAPLLSRFNIFEIPDPTFDERKILTKEIYFAIIENLKIKEKFSNHMDDEVLDFICKNDSSSRDLRKILTRAISNSVKRKDTKITIEDIHIENSFKSRIGFL